MSSEYRRNHYVPVWYQKRLVPAEQADNELYYLDLRPKTGRTPLGKIYTINELRKLGPKHCFYETDLYTRKIGGAVVTDIEANFFGQIDRRGQRAVAGFSDFEHNSGKAKHFQDLISYMSAQKLRTPKGLSWLRERTRGKSRQEVLATMVMLHRMFCAIWTECVWQIADAENSPTKLIISDHPVTVYNRALGPRAQSCRGHNDPDIRQNASHTIFPLSPDKVLILTNLSWARNPYQSEKELRPNPNPYRDAIFHVLGIQLKRMLTEEEVKQINFIIKSRAYRFLAAGSKEWLYPDRFISKSDWPRYGQGYLLMPDPRSMSRSGGIVLGTTSGHSIASS